MKDNLLNDILIQYKKLTEYCDNFFNLVYKNYNSQMMCKKGCYFCCKLESVLLIEAYVIENFIKNIRSKEKLKWSKKRNYCLFLNNKKCEIYEVRPIICRTHGLLLYYHKEGLVNTCKLNFNNLDSIENSIILDVKKVTENLVKLNLAFAIVIGKKDQADIRIFLKNLIGNNPKTIKQGRINFEVE